jgi:hypothetical protein
MTSLAATVAAATVALTLLASAVGHLRRPSGLVAALRAHAVLPARLTGPLAATVVGVEALLGVALVLGLWRGGAGAAGAAGVGDVAGAAGAGLGPLLAAAAGLFAAYAGYAGRVLWKRSDRVPCGCAGAEVELTGWVVGRAAALAAVALLGWWLAPSVLVMGWHAEAAIIGCAAGTFACLLAALPAAMAVTGEEARA